jgi:hypothetical protein
MSAFPQSRHPESPLSGSSILSSRRRVPPVRKQPEKTRAGRRCPFEKRLAAGPLIGCQLLRLAGLAELGRASDPTSGAP